MEKTAILMSRVSSDEQAKGYSLDIQTETIRNYCANNNIKILKEYKEDHSAKNFDRPEFKKLLQFAMQNKGKINYLIFTTWDRFSRNLSDALIIIDRLAKYGIDMIAVQQPIDLSIPENKAILAIYLAMPEIDNIRRSMKVKEGMRAALKSGRWCGSAPRGYKNSRDAINKPIIIASDDAKHIRKAFKLVSEGETQAEVRIKLKKDGYIISKSTLSDILKNPVYIGKLRINAFVEEGEIIIDGIHDGIIEEYIFYKVQNILNVNNKKRNQPKYKNVRQELPLRGVVYCSHCNSLMTGSRSKSRNGSYHFYYHCNHCFNTRVPAQNINNSMNGIISNLEFKESVKEIYKLLLKSELGENGQDSATQTKQLKAKFEEVENKQLKLQNLLLEGKIEPEDYAGMKERLSNEKSIITNHINELSSENNDFNKNLEQGISVISNTKESYENAGVAGKIRIAGSIFPEKLYFDGKKCRTTRINEVLRLMLLTNSSNKSKKNGQLSDYLELSDQVENIGLEPITFRLPV